MTTLDRSLTHALIANFKDLGLSGDGRVADQEAMLCAVLRLKGEALRLESRIEARERAGGVLQKSLAREDRARLKIVRDGLKQLQDLLKDSPGQA